VWSSSDKFYSTFLLQNAEHPRFTAQDRTKGGDSIPVSVPLSYALLDRFRQLSEALPGISLQHMNAHPNLSVETATQLAVFLANRPGALARVCDALAKAGINIYALATSDTVDHSVVRD
jgi:hypothetical protein